MRVDTFDGRRLLFHYVNNKESFCAKRARVCVDVQDKWSMTKLKVPVLYNEWKLRQSPSADATLSKLFSRPSTLSFLQKKEAFWEKKEIVPGLKVKRY